MIRFLLTASLLLVLAAPAFGAVLEPELRVGTAWFDRSQGANEGPSVLITPSLRLKDEDGELVYDLLYTPIWEYFLDERGVGGWNHDLRAVMNWRPTRRTTLRLTDRFLRAKSNRLFNVIAGTPTDPLLGDDVTTQLLVDERRVKSNIFTGGLTHRLSSAWSLALDGQHSWILEKGRRETRVFYGSGGLDRALSERNTVGASLNFTRQTTGPDGGSEQSTDFVGLSGRWTHLFDPTTVLRVRAGPTLVLPDDPPDPPTTFPGRPRFPLIQGEDGLRPVDVASCPTFDDGTPYLGEGCEGAGAPLLPGGASLFQSQFGDLPLVGELITPDNSSVTFFADLSLTKEWEDVDLRLSYRRSASSTASFGSSTIDDVLSANLDWAPTRRWDLGFSVLYRHQSSENKGRAFVPVLRDLQPGDVATFNFAGVPIDIPLARAAGESVGIRAIEVENDLTSDTIVLRFNAGYQLRKHIRIGGGLYYKYSTVSSSVEDSRLGDRYELSVDMRITYLFDPIHL